MESNQAVFLATTKLRDMEYYLRDAVRSAEFLVNEADGLLRDIERLRNNLDEYHEFCENLIASLRGEDKIN